MRYESKITEKGNVGVSFSSQEAADLQAAEMDKNGCSNCSNCSDCSYCSSCSDCSYCSGCSDCSYCSGCSDCSYCSSCSDCSYCSSCSECFRCSNCSSCSGCSYCSYCSSCSDCSYCSSCSECFRCSNCSNCSDCDGIVNWRGGEAQKLIALNGLTWPVSTDGKKIQIGCQCHSVADWEAFDDKRINSMDTKALEFWKAFKSTIMAMAAYRASLGDHE